MMSVLSCRGGSEARRCSRVHLCEVLADGHPLTIPLHAEARRPPARLLVVVISRGDARRTCIRTVALRGTQSCLQTEHRGEPHAVDSIDFKFLLSSSLVSSLVSSSFGASTTVSSSLRFDRFHFRLVMVVSNGQGSELPGGPDGLQRRATTQRIVRLASEVGEHVGTERVLDQVGLLARKYALHAVMHLSQIN